MNIAVPKINGRYKLTISLKDLTVIVTILVPMDCINPILILEGFKKFWNESDININSMMKYFDKREDIISYDIQISKTKYEQS